MGGDLRIIGEDVVNETAVVSIERPNLKRFTRCLHPLGEAPDFFVQLVLLDRTEMRAIHLDPLGLEGMSPQDAINEVLEIVESVAVLSYNSFAFARVDLQARPIVGFLDLNGCREAEMAKHRIKDLCCRLHRVHGRSLMTSLAGSITSGVFVCKKLSEFLCVICES